MTAKQQFTAKQAAEVAKEIGIDFEKEKFTLESFRRGMDVELEHGSEWGERTNVTQDDPSTTGRIALAHLLEIRDYYERLDAMEEEAEKYWEEQG